MMLLLKKGFVFWFDDDEMMIGDFRILFFI
jgi:hypothetical protein